MVPRNSGPSIMPPRIMPVYPLYMSGNMNTPAFHVAGTATILPPTAIYGGPQKIGPNIVRKTREICRLCVYRRSYLLWPAVNSRNSHPGSRSGLFLPPPPPAQYLRSLPCVCLFFIAKILWPFCSVVDSDR